MVDGLNTNSYSRLLLSDLNTAQGEMGKLARQISSGVQHEKYSELAEVGDTELVMSLEAKIEQVNAYQRANNTAISRINVTSESIDQVMDIATDFTTLSTQRRSANGELINFTQEAEALLNRAQDTLNITYEGLYLFSGSKTDTAPISDDIITTSNVGNDGLPTASYYQGDNFTASVQSSRTQNVSYGVAASDEAFQELFAAIHVGIDAHEGDYTDAQRDVLFEETSELINQAFEKLLSVSANVQGVRDRLEVQNDIFASTELFAQEQLSDISSTDLVSASARLSEYETILQTTFIAFTKLTGLSLVDYL